MSSDASSRDSQPGPPSASIGSLNPADVDDCAPTVDVKMLSKVEEQAKQIEEQKAMIKALNKQLAYYETDLQTHMDLVTHLETALGNAERDLRKARMQATELARERDSLRNELTGREEATRSENQPLEQRLNEERKAKERARQQLNARMEELQRRKSKFACL
ncbi:hypothetical protein H1R20_g9351, partial [Candolleomyces eurysporus]